MTISCGREEGFVGGAKNKLNSANLLWTLMIAGVFGGLIAGSLQPCS